MLHDSFCTHLEYFDLLYSTWTQAPTAWPLVRCVAVQWHPPHSSFHHRCIGTLVGKKASDCPYSITEFLSKVCMMGRSPIIVPNLVKRVVSAMPSPVFKGSKPPFVHDRHVTRDGHKKEIRGVSFGIVMPSLTCQDVNTLISLTREIKVFRDNVFLQV